MFSSSKFFTYGRGNLFAWGANQNGQLGDGTTTQRNSLTRIGSEKWTAVAASPQGLHSLAIRSDGKLFAWGSNQYGQLGDGTTTQRITPTKIGDDNWKSIAAGLGHSLAIRSDDKLFAWGYNEFGQLGDGTFEAKLVPTQIGNDSWKFISTQSMHCLAVRSDNGLFAWGLNNAGQVGDGTRVNRNLPVTISNGWWISAAAGSTHSLALTSDRSLYAWGSNNSGEIGNGLGGGDVTSPVRTGTDLWWSIAAGVGHSRGTSVNYGCYAWGLNSYGDWTENVTGSPILLSNQYCGNFTLCGNNYLLSRGVGGDLYVKGNLGIGAESAYFDTFTQIGSQCSGMAAGNNFMLAIIGG